MSTSLDVSGRIDRGTVELFRTVGHVTVAHAHNRALHHFPIDTFTVDGVLPWPAG